MQAGGYQQPQTVVVIQQQPSWSRRGPNYLNHGIRLSGVVLSCPVIVCLGMFGAMFVFAGIMTLSVSNSFDDDDFFDDSSSVVPGIFLLVIGGGLIVACICLARYAKKKYSQLNSDNDNPGRVINPAPSPMRQPNVAQPGLAPYGAPQAGGQMPQYSPSHANMAAPGAYPPQTGYSPQGGYNPQQPQGGYAPQQPQGGYVPQQPQGGYAPQQPQGGYAPQPPAGYFPAASGQPSDYPPPYSAPAGPVPGFPSAPGNETKYPLPSGNISAPPSNVPGMTQNTNEYTSPPPYAPGFK